MYSLDCFNNGLRQREITDKSVSSCLCIDRRLFFSNPLKLSEHTAFDSHVAEDTIFFLYQVPWGINFNNDALIKHDQLVIVDYRP